MHANQPQELEIALGRVAIDRDEILGVTDPARRDRDHPQPSRRHLG
jgi:hypothetical protein